MQFLLFMGILSCTAIVVLAICFVVNLIAGLVDMIRTHKRTKERADEYRNEAIQKQARICEMQREIDDLRNQLRAVSPYRGELAPVRVEADAEPVEEEHKGTRPFVWSAAL